MSNLQYGSGSYRKEGGKGCLNRVLTFLKNGCLLLVIFLALSPICVGILLYTNIIPWFEASQLENLPKAMADATAYIQEMNQPVPNDVILTDSIKALAQQKGFYQEPFDSYYQVQSCISAADRSGVLRKYLCALMDYEGGWPSSFEANTFLTALEKALGFLTLGYDPYDPEVKFQFVDSQGNVCEEPASCQNPTRVCANQTCTAILDYFQGSSETFQYFLDLSEVWSITNQASIRSLPPWVWIFWPGITAEFWTYYNLGYGELTAQFEAGPGNLPPFTGTIPDLPDGTFINPYPGSGLCGYSYGQPVGHYYHWGVDLCKGGQDWVLAGHNCTVSWVGNIPKTSQRAVAWWVSGETVACESRLSDGTTIWTVYGHGEPGTYQVRPGDQVRAGEPLMLADSTGFSTGNHLHYGMKINGSWVNPALTFP